MAGVTLYGIEAMSRFAGIAFGDERIPVETTILNFRHLLERHGLTEAIFAEVNAHLADKEITLRSGTLVDATIIGAPSSTTNQAKARDPKMSSTKKGNDRNFGMRARVGVNGDNSTVHSLEATTAKVHDSRGWNELLHGEEKSVWADKGYVSAKREATFGQDGKVWGVMRKAPKGGKLAPIDEEINRIIAMVRAKVGHPLRHHAPVRLHENTVWQLDQEQGASVHAVRARQPVPGATTATGMRNESVRNRHRRRSGVSNSSTMT